MVEGSPSWSAKVLMRHFRAASLIVASLFDGIARNSAANSCKDNLPDIYLGPCRLTG
jgi:hypothetical protein